MTRNYWVFGLGQSSGILKTLENTTFLKQMHHHQNALYLGQKTAGIEDTTFFIDVNKSNINLFIHRTSSTDNLVVAHFNGIFQHFSEGMV
jgi:hypothetical protein